VRLITCKHPPPFPASFDWRKASGSPIALPSQSSTIPSSSVQAGPDAYTHTELITRTCSSSLSEVKKSLGNLTHENPMTPMTSPRMSARIEGYLQVNQ